ncbi:acetyltransferase EpsM [Novosphingobium hassiacum]|uniref:Acetyltransferase EpsM n=1 Tax=Novosphingobium hassiacum TaxID=173676 RepID=A0A7W5ZSC8_9SPHN|nr:acetyltransferase EpsM [Novosphingobium hassiacum]
MDLVVIGASSLGKSVVQIARSYALYPPIGVVDDGVSTGSLVEGIPCLGRIDELAGLRRSLPEFGVVIAIGAPRTRVEVLARLHTILPKPVLLTIIHPTAVFLGNVHVGEGTIVFPGCVVGPGVEIGRASILNANVSIGAGSHIGEYVNLCPGANIGSEAWLGDGTYVGMGAAVAQQVRLDDWSVLGALSFAREDVPAATTVVGSPARSTGDEA